MTDKGESGGGVTVRPLTSNTPDLMPVLMRVVVGSQAHGLARPDSDFDFREVFYTPTRELLQVPRRNVPKDAWASITRVDDDEGGWELAKFLDMVMLGHPNSVELLWAPAPEGEELSEEALELRALAPSLLSAREIRRSSLGYAQNCINKLVKGNQQNREVKWKYTYLRILGSFAELLDTGTLPVRVPYTGWGAVVREAQQDRLTVGEVIDVGHEFEARMQAAGKSGPFADEPNGAAVNEWLMEFRLKHWGD